MLEQRLGLPFKPHIIRKCSLAKRQTINLHLHGVRYTGHVNWKLATCCEIIVVSCLFSFSLSQASRGGETLQWGAQ